MVLRDGPTRDALINKENLPTGGSLVNPGGPTEQALDAQNEKARNARRNRFTQVARHILDSDEPKFKDITNRNAAESMAGLVVGKEVNEQRSSSKEGTSKVNSEGYPPLALISAGPITTDLKRDGTPEFEVKTVQFTQDRERTAPHLSRKKSKETGDSRSEKPSSSRLVLKTKEERRKSIISNSEGTIYLKKNPKADGDEPLHAIHAAGRAAVEVFDKIIETEARKQGVDPNLVRAIVYVENAQGWYAKPFEGFGTKPFKGLGPLEKLGVKTYFPMNIHVEFWGPLGFRGKNYLRAQTNVHVGVKLIKRIAERLDRPTIAKIATLYNSISKDSVTDYGARVARVYRDRSWQKRD